ncbi:hypothetical protein F5Y03DRAFT_410425 [Xylaria venustula]|nr:hypothetical protein F5Y03DRAFT_410425 [Xylaria venustula]
MELDGPEHRNTTISQDICLDDLEIKFYEDIETSAPRSEIFGTLMTWLNGQIKQDIITQSERLLARFARLLHVCHQTNVEPSALTRVDDMFNKWLEKDAIQNPAYRRRYLITQQDLHRLLFEEIRDSQIPRAFSMSDNRGRTEDNHPSDLSLRQKKNTAKSENEDTKLTKIQQDTDYDTIMSAAPECSANVEKVAVDKSKRSGGFKYKRDVPQQPDDSHSQDADKEDMAITRAAIQMDFPPAAKISPPSTRASRRARYICKRCNKSGHMIQHCPTNLDPRYDQEPDQDYRCDFCGRHGNHYATLCPKNPHESSLTKQRERAEIELREPRTPSRNSRRDDQNQEISLKNFRKRYRSHSLKRRSQHRYRSRSPERYYYRRRGAGGYSPRTGNNDEHWPPFSDESDESPYKTRVRRSREAHMSISVSENRGKESPSESGNDGFPFGHLKGSHSPSRRIRTHLIVSSRQRHKDLDKVTRSDEGRLAYDDESDALGEIKSSPCSIVTTVTGRTFSIGKDEVTGSEIPSVTLTPENPDKTKDEIEDFLCALAADIMMERTDNHRSTGVDVADAERGTGSNLPMDTTSIHDDDNSDVVAESELPAIVTTPSPRHRLVQCPPFSPEVVSLFSVKETPIINVRSNRKTASQMMGKSEGCWIPRDDKVMRVPQAADLEDGVRAINSFLDTPKQQIRSDEWAW